MMFLYTDSFVSKYALFSFYKAELLTFKRQTILSNIYAEQEYIFLKYSLFLLSFLFCCNVLSTNLFNIFLKQGYCNRASKEASHVAPTLPYLIY